MYALLLELLKILAVIFLKIFKISSECSCIIVLLFQHHRKHCVAETKNRSAKLLHHSQKPYTPIANFLPINTTNQTLNLIKAHSSICKLNVFATDQILSRVSLCLSFLPVCHFLHVTFLDVEFFFLIHVSTIAFIQPYK